MEVTLLHRLKLRRDRLMAAVESIESECSSGIAETDIPKRIVQLNALNDVLEKESKYYLEHSSTPNTTVMNESLEIQVKAEDLLLKLQSHTASSKATADISTTKLPKMELPKYDGSQLRWCEFWDKFKSNVDEKGIADVDKLSYLLSCLQGAAFNAVAGLPVTGPNYQIVVETLQRRFGSKSLQIDSHYIALNNIPKAEYNSDSCRITLDKIEHHLRVLETLGEPGNGNHFRAIVLAKFPDQIIHEHHLLGDADNSMITIRKNLERIVLAMERSTAFKISDSQITFENINKITSEALHIKTVPKKFRNNPRKRGLDKKVHGKDGPPHKKIRSCLFCDLKNHNSSDCKRIKSPELRMQKIKESGRCSNCLYNNHKTEECRKKISCFCCKGSHLLMFCPNRHKDKGISSSDTNALDTICNISYNYTYLQTAVATLKNPNNDSRQTKVRLLLDSGSQRSYITQRIANKVNLKTKKQDLLLIYTFGASEPSELSSPLTEIIIETKRDISRRIHVNVVMHITDKIPLAKFDHKCLDILADDGSVGEEIDLLIGNDYYWSFIRDEKYKVGTNLYHINTDFGWMLAGNTITPVETSTLSVTTYCQCHIPNCPYFTEPDLPLRNLDVKFLWSLESIGITDNPKATRQEEAVKYFNETVQYQDGRYYVKWPWIQYPPELSSNFGLAMGRLKSLIKRTNEETFREYDSILKEQLQSGIIELINPNNDNESNQVIHYLPHHMVKQKGKRGRLVYDASAKTAGQKSLNECLYSGPSFLEDLTALLLNFRMKKIAIMADVEKAFLQVGLQKEDRDVTRFLWVKDLSKEPSYDNLLYLRFCRIPFGIISSPMLLTATIRHHMAQSRKGDLLKTIADKCYVDNFVTSVSTLNEATEIYQQTRESFRELGMNIRDWVSNNKDFMDFVEKQYRAADAREVKVLGLTWNIHKDTLKLNISDEYFERESLVNTKRKVLQIIARIYDPFGFVCPLVLPMKIHFQNICKMKMKWDSELPDDLVQMLKTNLKDLSQVKHVELPRYIGVRSEQSKITYELHAFTDASRNAYATVVYLRAESENDTTISFLMAKSRISRLEDKEDLRIPRLELLGFLIGSRMLTYLRNNLKHPIKKEYLWTDSLVVLSWMNTNKLLPPFVANRVKEIQENHSGTKMFYINSKSNPADIATRPEVWEYKKDLWYSGPNFLKEPESEWPVSRFYNSHHQTLLSFGEILERCSDEIDVDTNMDDVSEKMIGKENIHTDRNTLINNTTDENVIEIKKLQKVHFSQEVSGKQTHLSRNLNLFLDVDGVLRCRGRMANATWNYDMRYPILLPKDCELTRQIIRVTHEQNYHVGAAHTLSIIRKRYWIPQGKSQVINVLRQCTQCKKHGGGPYKLPAAPALPPERVNYSDPFTYTGVDYFGPLFINTQTRNEKRWVALFTCLAVRAIHLEIVNDLTADECLLALRRFAATRGAPKRLYSDNATCFKLTSEVVTKPFCIERKIEWKFIPQLAPWHGGFYERLVGLVKNCLKKTLEKHVLNESKLLTVMKEVESVVNSRPITQVGPEIDNILRPADFLGLKDCCMIETATVEMPPEGTSVKIDLIKSWKRGLKIIEEFKHMFIGQYLINLRERTKHLPKQPRVKSHRQPQIGDVVQIWSDSRNRETWKIGKIIALIKGLDGECRVAKVQTKDLVFTRSIGHLYPLEVDGENYGIDCSDLRQDKNPNNYESVNHNELTNDRIVIPQDQSEATEKDDTFEAVNEELTDSDPIDREVSQVEVDQAVDTQHDTLCSGKEDVSDLPLVMDGVLKSKRQASIRASERIREWTRHLLTLLH